MIQSIVILKHGDLGYVAELRFSDTNKDCSVSSNNHESIYYAIERALRERA